MGVFRQNRFLWQLSNHNHWSFIRALDKTSSKNNVGLGKNATGQRAGLLEFCGSSRPTPHGKGGMVTTK